MQVRVCVCVWTWVFTSLGWMPGSVILGPRVSVRLVFFFKKLPSHFLEWVPLLQSCSGVCVCDLQPVASSVFFISAVLTGAWRYLAIAPTGVSWLLIALAISSWLVCHPCHPFRGMSSVHFVSLGSSSERSLYLLNVILCQRHELQILSPNLSLIFSSSLWELLQGKSFRF